MRVALYARVSLDAAADSRRFQDPENQLMKLREWARALDYEVIQEYIDKDSGANSARKAFRQMMNDAMRRHFRAILVWKLDRFSREGTLRTLSYIEKLRARGIALKSMTESWMDTAEENPIADIVLAVMSWAAAEERKKISDRTKAGIARKRAIGQWKGGRPKKGTPPKGKRKKAMKENVPFKQKDGG